MRLIIACVDAVSLRRGNGSLGTRTSIIEAFGRGPVGKINLFLDPRAMELAVGEAVDRENVAGIFFEPALEFQKRPGISQLPGGGGAQAQSDSEPIFWAHPGANGQGVCLQGIQGFRPGSTSMDIRAISKMQIMIEFHRPAKYK